MQDTHNETKVAPTLDITGVLLAGGSSRRMGRDKATLEFNGAPLYQQALDLLRICFSAVLIAGDRPDLASDLLPYFPDTYPGSALGGLYTSLTAAETEWVFVMPCDLPFPDRRILDILVALRNGHDAVVPLTPKGYEPVFALYNQSCLPIIEEMLHQDRLRVYEFFQKIDAHFLHWQELPNGWERAFTNINTPEDLDRLREDFR